MFAIVFCDYLASTSNHFFFSHTARSPFVAPLGRAPVSRLEFGWRATCAQCWIYCLGQMHLQWKSVPRRWLPAKTVDDRKDKRHYNPRFLQASTVKGYFLLLLNKQHAVPLRSRCFLSSFFFLVVVVQMYSQDKTTVHSVYLRWSLIPAMWSFWCQTEMFTCHIFTRIILGALIVVIWSVSESVCCKKVLQCLFTQIFISPRLDIHLTLSSPFSLQFSFHVLN